ncbi:MAG: AraC family transcriptional regulator [Labilithrix sp.]|nr:AraC family transcriptional regulator [Labilithrix sp.]
MLALVRAWVDKAGSPCKNCLMGKGAESLRAIETARANGSLTPANELVTLSRHLAPDDLAEIVEHVWIARWELDDRAHVEREVVPFPCVNVVFGDHRPGVHGPVTSRFVAHLSGAGSVVGIKFRPAGFRALLRPGIEPVQLVDHPFAVSRALAAGVEATALGAALATAETDAAKVDLVTRFVRAVHPGVDDDDREVNAVGDLARRDPTLTRVAWLAEHAGRPVRALERLFRSRIGVSPKWVIRRFRVQEAAARLAKGIRVDLAALAQLLGYCDQSHLIQDFRSQVGRTPARHLAHCAARA